MKFKNNSRDLLKPLSAPGTLPHFDHHQRSPGLIFRPGEVDMVYGKELVNSLPKVVLEVVQLDCFGRLFFINQSGWNYPCHSRGVHSVGVALLASLLYNKNCPGSRDEFVLGALLHDLGHAPFSHSWEQAFPEVHHKDLTIQKILGDSGLQKIFKSYSINPQSVIQIALEKFDGNPFTVQRESGACSFDHFDNTLRDLSSKRILVSQVSDLMSLEDQFKRKMQEMNIEMIRKASGLMSEEIASFLQQTTVNKEGQLQLIDGNHELWVDWMRHSLAHNCRAVFSPRGTVGDAMGKHILIEGRRMGFLDALGDANKADPHVLNQIVDGGDDNLKRQIAFLLGVLPVLSEEEVGKVVQKQKPDNEAVNDAKKERLIADAREDLMDGEYVDFANWLKTKRENFDDVFEQFYSRRGEDPKNVEGKVRVDVALNQKVPEGHIAHGVSGMYLNGLADAEGRLPQDDSDLKELLNSAAEIRLGMYSVNLAVADQLVDDRLQELGVPNVDVLLNGILGR